MNGIKKMPVYRLSLLLESGVKFSARNRALGQKLYEFLHFGAKKGGVRLDSRWLIGALALAK